MNFSTRKKRRGLFNSNLDVRSVLESECYSVVFVYRCSFQKCKPLPFVPGFKDEGLFFYCADEDAKFSVSLHPAVTLCGCCVQPIHRRFITLDQTVVLPGLFVLGLLLGSILLDALADQFCNYLQFFVQGFDFCIEFGAISHHLAHCFTGFEVLLTGAHQLIKGFEEGLLNDLCIKGRCLALGFTIELAIASPNLSAVSFMPESRKGLWNKDFCKKKKERKLQYQWYHNFRSYLAGAEGLGLACRLGQCFCTSCRGLHRRPAPLDTLRVPSVQIIQSEPKQKDTRRCLFILAGAEGLEPSARGFGDRCSTN